VAQKGEVTLLDCSSYIKKTTDVYDFGTNQENLSK